MYLPAARVSAPKSKKASTEARQPGTSRSISSVKAWRPQGRVASMCVLPSLAVVMTRKLSGTMCQGMSSPKSLTMVSRQPPGLSSLPNSHSSWSAVSNSKRPLRKLEATPPGRLCCSTNRVFFPARASRQAAARPPFPAPMTTASNFGISIPPYSVVVLPILLIKQVYSSFNEIVNYFTYKGRKISVFGNAILDNRANC